MYDKSVDIIMVTYLREFTTTGSLMNLRNRTKTNNRVILVDNGSNSQSVKEWLDNSLVDIYIRLEENKGLEIARNIGTSFVNSEYVVHIDNDILVPNLDPDWIQQLIGLLESNHDFGVVSLRPQQMVGVGPIFRNAPEIVETNVVGGTGRIMKTDLLRSIGGWDNEFRAGGRGREEWDICGKVREVGLKVGYARDLWCYHEFIDNNWGYPKGMDFHRVLKEAPKDIPYDPDTMEPSIRGNE